MIGQRRVGTGRLRARVAAMAVAGAMVLAACGSGSGAPSDATITVTGTDALQYRPAEVSVAAGTITIELIAEPGDEHTLVIEELDDTEVVAADAGASASGTIELDAGTYTFYCNIEGHRAAGMEGTLTVTE